MLRQCSNYAAILIRSRQVRQTRCIRFYSTDNRTPPRILFFGSDGFSLKSLEKLREARNGQPDLYQSIEIVTREPAPKGRGLALQKGVIQEYAEQNNIDYRLVNKKSIFDVDPSSLSVDLLIAVSFGLFIPPALIRAVPSSINVHPSLLPQYRGPAPIHNAIYNGDQSTGVSIQTISPEAFDRGIVFAQSASVPIGEQDTLTQVWDQLAEIGADMLVDCIRQRTYLNPEPIEPTTKPSYAGSIQKSIDWHAMTATQAVRLGRILSPLTGAVAVKDGRRKDIVVGGIHPRDPGGGKLVPGSFFLTRYWKTGDQRMAVVCCDGTTVWVDKVKVGGKVWISGQEFVASASDRFWGQRFVPWRREFDDHDPKEFEY